MIRLTMVSMTNERELWVAANKIIALYKEGTGTRIQLDRFSYEVKETIEEILDLMEEFQ